MNRSALAIMLFSGLAPLLAGAEPLKTVTLTDCVNSAMQHHPLSRGTALVTRSETEGKGVDNALYLPRLSLQAKASTQSDAISISSPIFTVEGETEQWQLVSEVSQLLFDGGAIEAHKASVRAVAEVDRRQLSVDLETVEERVRDTYFEILLFNAQITQNTLLLSELSDNRSRLEALRQNGMAIAADIDSVEVETLKAEEKGRELVMLKAAATRSLSSLSALPLDSSTLFAIPEVSTGNTDDGTLSADKAELSLFAGQKAAQEVQKKALRAALLPRISAYAQAGWSDPGLNMLKSGSDTWWVAGIKGSWAIDNCYSYRTSSAKIDSTLSLIDMRIESWKLNQTLAIDRQRAKIAALEAAIDCDQRVIVLRTRIKETAEAKNINGVLSTSDLLREINAESEAREMRALHGIELLSAKSALEVLTGAREIH